MNVISTITASRFTDAPIGSVFLWKRVEQTYLCAKVTWNNGVGAEDGAVLFREEEHGPPVMKSGDVFQRSPAVALLRNAQFRISPALSELHLSGISRDPGKIIICEHEAYLAVVFGHETYFHNLRTGELVPQLPNVVMCGVDSWSLGEMIDEDWIELLTFPHT